MLAFALLTCTLLSAPAPPAWEMRVQRGDDTGSLESFLARARVERDALQARFRSTIDELVARLQADRRPARLALDEIRDELDGLGPEAATILLPLIDPGAEPTDATQLRAREITNALERLHPAGIVGDLIRGTRTFGPEGRLNAIELLGVVPEYERAGDHLALLFAESKGDARLRCVVALAALPTDRHSLVLRNALADDDPAVVRAVLAALAESKNASAVPAVLNLTRVPAAAAPVAGELIRFWLTCPELVDDETVDALIRLTLHTAVETAACVSILEALPKFENADTKALKKKLGGTLQSTNPVIKEAALVCTTVLGDRSAKRELLQTYDETVHQNDKWFKGYLQRAEILMRIHEYDDAAKDLKDALELLGERAHVSTHEDTWINLARCYALSRKISKAADALEEMGMSRAVKERLRADPDFAPLLESSRYAKLFE